MDDPVDFSKCKEVMYLNDGDGAFTVDCHRPKDHDLPHVGQGEFEHPGLLRKYVTTYTIEWSVRDA